MITRFIISDDHKDSINKYTDTNNNRSDYYNKYMLKPCLSISQFTSVTEVKQNI